MIRFLKRARGSRRWTATALALALVSSVVAAVPAFAAHPESSLTGSNFEIDLDANLKLNDASPSIDWANVTEIRRADAPTGRNDDSYAGGAKEDDTCPGTTTGSIPNNKSDLLSFGVYTEAGNPGFLHLFWTRVNEPSGTTLMDFELNQSAADCGNGVNRVRTAGDLLIEYKIEQGGATATIVVREWTGTVWGPEQDLTAVGAATGTINNSAIPAAESDGLITAGSISPRTFGEASLDLDFIFDEGSCTSFGSSFLKSRASDSFTSQLKDYIAPQPINITNCGTVIIRKQTDPEQNPNMTSFGFTKAFATDPSSANTFNLTDDGVQTFNNVLFGTGLTVSEDAPPSGWTLQGVNCSASTGVTPSVVGATVTFAIDNANDVLDCTYTNQARGSIIVEKITDDGTGTFQFTSGTLTPASFSLTTTSAGAAGKDSDTFADLSPGTYDVAETVPAGWNLVSSSCSDGSSPGSIGLSAGETVTCTFHNARETGAILITKTRKHAAGGSGDQPHAGVTFKVTGGNLPAAGIAGVTDANGELCVSGLVLSSFVGGYTVTETVPAGYAADGATAKAVSVTTESTCGDDNEANVSFGNTPLTDVTVSVNSQVVGGTASTMQCTDSAGTVYNGATTAGGDGSLTVSNLLPTDPTVTLTCTITIDP